MVGVEYAMAHAWRAEDGAQGLILFPVGARGQVFSQQALLP